MKNKIIFGIVATIIITICIVIFAGNNKECNEQAIEFKNTYEKYNDNLEKLNIDEDNPMSKINKEDIINKIDSSNGIIFFGNPKNNESRILINELLKVAPDYNCEVVYYYNLMKLDINSEIYSKLKEKLGDYELKNSIIIFYKKGEISKYVEYNKDSKEINKNIKEGFNSINGGMCEVAKQC